MDDVSPPPVLHQTKGRRRHKPPLNVAAPPPLVDRRTGAELVSHLVFPVSPRTLEGWPLVTRRVNGKALYDTVELLAYARAKVAAAPVVQGGRKRQAV